MGSRSRVYNLIRHTLLFLSELIQWLADRVFSPDPRSPSSRLTRPKIAIIGAGVTGITSAAHCVGHGFEVTIFEAGSEESVGGIWSRVDTKSGLRIQSLTHRFHPRVKREQGCPDRQQIVSRVRELWENYGLVKRTRFNTRIEKVYKDDKGRWVLNNTANGRFEGIIAAVGTCGEAEMPELAGMYRFKGDIYHSSQLTGKQAKGKTLIVIGGGTSAVDALEFAAEQGAAKTYVLARSDECLMPRKPSVDHRMAVDVPGRETVLSWILDALLRRLSHRHLDDPAPARDDDIFVETPTVKSDLVAGLRSGEAEWVRCDVDGFVDSGVRVSRRASGITAGGPGSRETIEADVVVMATGYRRPGLSFLPGDCFVKPYEPPNWYLQTFPPTHPSISCINWAGIGTVGNWHIAIYTRILLMFLVHPPTRPSPFWMRRWIDMTRLLKFASPVGLFDFFAYLELICWVVFCISFNPFRWKWCLFVFFDLGSMLPNEAVTCENGSRRRLGMRAQEGRHLGSTF